jgi:flagellar biosynthesis GTPase FlhF
MNDLAVIPESKEIESGIVNINDRAIMLQVIDNETYIVAGEMLLTCKEMEKKIKDFFKPHKDNAYNAHKALCKAETDELNKLNPGINHLKKEISSYQQEQERLRRIEEKRLREIARKEEEERKLREALQAEAEGNNEEAQAIIDEPIEPPPVIVPKSTPKIEGITSRIQWNFRIVNESKIPREYLIPDRMKIGAVVRALKGAAKIDGIEVYSESNIAAGRR